MLLNRVALLGEADSGKTQIVLRLIDAPFVENYKKTNGPSFYIASKNKVTAMIWDTCSDDEGEMMDPNLSMGLYCVDLSKEINIGKIKAGIKAYREKCPKTTLILVGTKCDICPDDAKALFSAIPLDTLDADMRVMTSAKTNFGIKELSDFLLTKPSNAQKSAQEQDVLIDDCKLTLWDITVSKLEYALTNLPQEKKAAMQKQLSILKTSLRENPYMNVSPAVNHFLTESQTILEDKHPSIMKKVLKLAIVAVVTILAALVGFGIGFAAGLWTGPGAFITGFMAGSTAAVSVATASIIAGGLTAHGLFKEPKELTTAKHFADEIKARPAI